MSRILFKECKQRKFAILREHKKNDKCFHDFSRLTTGEHGNPPNWFAVHHLQDDFLLAVNAPAITLAEADGFTSFSI
jgi:hypothetical protein